MYFILMMIGTYTEILMHLNSLFFPGWGLWEGKEIPENEVGLGTG